LSELIFFIKSALNNLWESKVTTGFTALTLSIAMGFMGAYLAFFINMESALGAISERFPLTVYVSDRISDQQLEDIGKALTNSKIVAEFTYTSKKRALEEFRETLAEGADILNAIGDNPLPASFDISIKAGMAKSSVDELIAGLEGMKGIVEVQYLKEEADKLRSLLSSVMVIGVLVGLGVLFGVVFISYSTLRLAVLNHTEEIEVMKLMGATRFFIMAPFLLEGAIQGLGSAALSLGLLYLFLKLFSGAYSALLLTPGGFEFLPFWAWSGLMVAGGLLGLMGSFFAFSRTLRL